MAFPSHRRPARLTTPTSQPHSAPYRNGREASHFAHRPPASAPSAFNVSRVFPRNFRRRLRRAFFERSGTRMASLKSTSSDIRSMTRCAFERLVPPQKTTATSSFVRLARASVASVIKTSFSSIASGRRASFSSVSRRSLRRSASARLSCFIEHFVSAELNRARDALVAEIQRLACRHLGASSFAVRFCGLARGNLIADLAQPFGGDRDDRFQRHRPPGDRRSASLAVDAVAHAHELSTVHEL